VKSRIFRATIKERKMKTYVALTIAGLALQGISMAQAQSAPAAPFRSPNEAQQCAEIEDTIKGYERALNASDVGAVVRLFAEDAVLLAPEAPSAVGIKAVQEAYTGIFQAIDLDLTFKVAEVKLLSPEWAFLRSQSSGSIRILANGAQVPSGNQELFVLRKSQGHWKIARYAFSTVLPAAR
jgi:uncharacterized protein (TIGR02246 family)